MKNMKRLAAFMAAVWLMAQAGSGAQSPQIASCAFVLAHAAAGTAVIGPDEVLSRLHIMTQPDSPIEIPRADFTGTQLVVTGNNYTIQQNSSPTLDVRNRSDQSICGPDTRPFLPFSPAPVPPPNR
jgi:hypothetical protein